MLSGFNLIQLFIIISETAFKNNSNLSLNIDDFQILVHLGLLSKQSGWGFAENQFKGESK